MRTIPIVVYIFHRGRNDGVERFNSQLEAKKFLRDKGCAFSNSAFASFGKDEYLELHKGNRTYIVRQGECNAIRKG